MRNFIIIHIISFKHSPLIHNQQRHSMFKHKIQNLNNLKFISRISVSGEECTKDFPSAKDAYCLPLAKMLFRIEKVKAIFFGPDFITVTKLDEDVEKKLVKSEIFITIMNFFVSGLPIMETSQLTTDTRMIHNLTFY